MEVIAKVYGSNCQSISLTHTIGYNKFFENRVSESNPGIDYRTYAVDWFAVNF